MGGRHKWVLLTCRSYVKLKRCSKKHLSERIGLKSMIIESLPLYFSNWELYPPLSPIYRNDLAGVSQHVVNIFSDDTPIIITVHGNTD